VERPGKSLSVSGDVLFARYAFPPNELGYCGPDDADVLLEHATSGTVTAAEIQRRAKLFDGAWVYLELIAAATGIADPMDARVVEAYWIGNELLDAVDSQAVVAMLRERLAGQLVGPAGHRWGETGPALPAMAHHSFHVFAVYPWLDLLTRQHGAARTAVALSVLERCRIRWGTVSHVDGDRVQVLSRPLAWNGRRLALGPERVEAVRFAVEGHAPPDPPSVGDTVACHWDWVCGRLSAAQTQQLAARSLRMF
jgi:uncharacterized protein DUF6390